MTAKELEATVLESMTRYNMLGRARRAAASSPVRVAAAVSGGPDSVCLLHVLCGLAPRLNLELSVAHFNHKLRGRESDEDERFVARLAARLGLAFHRAEAAVSPPPGNLEQSARRERAEFFAALRTRNLAGRIALGHTRDDQSETVLFRLLRGTGISGLAGVLPVTREGIIRPLIGATRAQVLEYLRSRSIEWREDASNRDPRFARNRIRASLLPQLEAEWNPRLRERLADLADIAYEEERDWALRLESAARDQLVWRAGGVELETAAIARMTRALARRIVRRAVAGVKGDLRRIEYRHIEQVLELIGGRAGEGRLELPGVYAVRSFGWVRIAASAADAVPAPLTLAIPGKYPAPGGDSLVHLGVDHSDPRAKKGLVRPYGTLKTAELNLRRIPEPLELRGWKPGDHYRPLGASRECKISDLFQNARVPSWRRPFWPIVTGGGKILWARDFGAAEEYAAGGGGPVLRVWEAETEDG